MRRGLRRHAEPGPAADQFRAGERLVARTNADALAIAIGTSHVARKFSRLPTGDTLTMARIAAIHAAVPNTPLVMHGSSSVPQEWLDILRQYGGEIPETYGVSVKETAVCCQVLSLALGDTRATPGTLSTTRFPSLAHWNSIFEMPLNTVQ